MGQTYSAAESAYNYITGGDPYTARDPQPEEPVLPSLPKPSWSIVEAELKQLWRVDFAARDLTFLEGGQLAAVDSVTDAVHFFDEDGKKLDRKYVGTIRYGSQPQGICADVDGRLEVACTKLKCICHVYWKPKDVRETAIQWAKGVLEAPKCVCRSPSGSIVACDSQTKDVHVFNEKSRRRLRKFGEKYLDAPECVACDSMDRIYLTDSEQKCVKVFQMDGTYLYDIGKDQLLSPRGIVTDPKCHILVADTWSDAVSIFAPDGRYISNVIFDQAIEQPTCVAVDWESKRFAVATKSMRWTHVQVFQIKP